MVYNITSEKKLKCGVLGLRYCIVQYANKCDWDSDVNVFAKIFVKIRNWYGISDT